MFEWSEHLRKKRLLYEKNSVFLQSGKRKKMGNDSAQTPPKLRLHGGRRRGLSVTCDLTIHAAFALIFVISGENGGTQISIKKFAAAQYLLSEDVMEGI